MCSCEYNTILIEHAIELAEGLGESYVNSVAVLVNSGELEALSQLVDEMNGLKILLEA